VEILTSLALGATATALGWQAYQRRHDPLVLGLLGLAEFVPAVLLALPAGHVIDHHDRRLVAGLGLAWGTAIAIVLAIDAAAGDTAVWPLYVLAFTWGVGNAFVGPTIGGITQTIGAPAPYLFAAAFSGGAAILLPLVPRAIGVAHVGDHEPQLADVLDGVRLIFRSRPLLGAI